MSKKIWIKNKKQGYLNKFPVINDIEILENPEKIKRKNNHIKSVPKRKICEECGIRRVKHHHYKCDICWKKLNL